VAPTLVQVELHEPGRSSLTACPQPAPCAAVEAEIGGPAELTWRSGDDRLTATYDGWRVSLRVTTGAGPRPRASEHRSRRFGRVRRAVSGLALTLTGGHLTAFTREAGEWIGRARVDLAAADDARVDSHDPNWLAGLEVGHRGEVAALRAGAFGQLGLRDLRVVSESDGSPYLRDGKVLLTATSAGPGFFDTAHTSVWALDPVSLALDHLSDLYFGRDGGVYADHATHLVRDGASWLVATSTWADFPHDHRRRADARVGITLARTDADVLGGRHLLTSEPLHVPTEPLDSVGVWDPHLVRTEREWLVGYVSARKYFDFHPALAAGPRLDELTLRAAATDRRATEGTTIVRLGEQWRVLASDGRDNPPGLRAAYPIFDLDLRQIDTLRSEYPTNLPWPTLVRVGHHWLHVAFDGTPAGGGLLGYGTHGTVVISRSSTASERLP